MLPLSPVRFGAVHVASLNNRLTGDYYRLELTGKDKTAFSDLPGYDKGYVNFRVFRKSNNTFLFEVLTQDWSKIQLGSFSKAGILDRYSALIKKAGISKSVKADAQTAIQQEKG